MSTKTELEKRVAKAKIIIESNSHKSLRTDELASEVAMSTFHFIRTFKEVYRMSPYQYVLKVRLRKACEMLLQTPLKATEIADISGFPDIQSFCKTFRKNYGTTPVGYRKSLSA